MTRALIVITAASEREKAIRWIGKAPWNTRIEFKAPKRSLPQNDRMWAMLTDVAAHMKQRGRDYTTDQWKAVFMHACGKEVSFLPSLDGKTFIPWGQSSSDLSKQEMTDLIEFIAAWGAENGVTFNEPQPPDGQSPVVGEGSGVDSPVDPAADPSDAGNGVEAETGAIEADHGDAAASVSGLDPVKRMLCEECVENMLRDAFSDPAIDRPAKVDKLREVFLEKQNLGDFPDFVNRCHETARRIIGKPGERERAKAYLLGKVPA